jgi:acyl carrier protein phosphodiesterase
MIVGALLGDLVKGRINGRYDEDVERGIRLHRAIDAYTDQHPCVRGAARRFEPRFRRYAGIMTDIIFDHYLALAWRDFHSGALDDFSARVFSVLDESEHLLPARGRRMYRGMRDAGAMASYRDPVWVDRALRGVGQRLTRANPLAEGYDAFVPLATELKTDFEAFYPQLIAFADTRRDD